MEAVYSVIMTTTWLIIRGMQISLALCQNNYWLDLCQCR